MSINEHQRQLSIKRLVKRFPVEALWWECWTVSTSRIDGYATFGNGVNFDDEIYIHRIVWEAIHGELPEGWEVDHLCFTRNCANPFHLAGCPLPDNRKRKNPANRVQFCPKQHPLSGDNLYVNPRTKKRSCRECMRIANRRAHHRYKDDRNAQRAARRRRSRT